MKFLNLIKVILGIIKSSEIIKGDAGKIIDAIDPDLITGAVQGVMHSAVSNELPMEERSQKLIVDHNLPEEFKWIYKLGQIPKTMNETLKFCGLLEDRTSRNNPTILQWAKELKISKTYNDDSIAWCGLFQAIGVSRAGYPLPVHFLAAKSWLNYGNHVEIENMAFGDIVVLNRDNNPALGHVARYIGETDTLVCLYGGNQSDSCCFAWFSKDRIAGVRRDPFKIAAPVSVKKYKLVRGKGLLSTNER